MANPNGVPTVAEFLNDVTQRRIHYRVARLGRKFALSREDLEDLQQDFRMAILSARTQYDPAKCPLERFVKMVLNRRYKYHVRQQCQLSHHRGRTPNTIALDEVDPKTMESRLVQGLFICGELLDIDAGTGGFNLQAAFSTGCIAGESAALFSGFPSEN